MEHMPRAAACPLPMVRGRGRSLPPERQSSAISKRLSELGAKVIKFPLIAIETIPNERLNQSTIANYNYLILL